MRTDVKLGLVFSVLVIVVAGWYFVDREETGADIPLADDGQVLTFAPPKPQNQPQTSPPPKNAPRTLAATSPVDNADDADSTHPVIVKRSGDDILSDLFDAQKRENPNLPLQDDDPDREATGTAAQSGPRLETHTVRAGDTILALARTYYGNIRYAKQLLDANPHVVDPTALATGTEISLPNVRISEPPPTAKTTPRPKPQPTKPAARAGKSYTVAAGDTLYRIAMNRLGEGTRWTEIYDLNKSAIGDDPAALKIGQILQLPPR